MKLSPLWRHLQPRFTSREACAQPATPLAETGNDRLAWAALGQSFEIVSVHAPDASPDWARWLSEIGFIPGESATVRARSPWGDGALVVRIGMSNFALRREEAACVAIKPL